MTLTITSRQDWGARPPSGGIPDLAYPVSDVFLHHEGGGDRPASMTIEQELAAMLEIQAYAMGEGYVDFPYGISVFGSGRAYEGRDLGFVAGGTTEQQAATFAHNMRSVSIVWPGNYQRQTPTGIQIANTADVIKIAQLAGVITVLPNLRGHRDVYGTACPGNSAYDALPQVRAALATSGPSPVVPVRPPEVVDVLTFPCPGFPDIGGNKPHCQFAPKLEPHGGLRLRWGARIHHDLPVEGKPHSRTWAPPLNAGATKWVSAYERADNKGMVLVDDKGGTTDATQGFFDLP